VGGRGRQARAAAAQRFLFARSWGDPSREE
jgi:hypothetical protein